MQSILNRKTIILIALGILFTLSPINTNSLNFNAGNSDKINLDNEIIKLSAVSRKIHIDDNWTDTKAAGICTGEGTYSNPYIIEDLVIDGGGAGSCIFIENSDVYFKIENCTIYYAGPSGRSFLEAGIKLEMVSNGSLINNNASNNNVYGIYLWYSNNNTISGNTANNNFEGIYLGGSDRNIVSGNTVNNNNEKGITLLGSSNNTISGNTANNNSYGIGLTESDCNIISGNNLIGNFECIFETDCNGNVFENNDCGADIRSTIPILGLVMIGISVIGIFFFKLNKIKTKVSV
ncbi:MAG: right-handed parallel beta-helix repeat-containing protein [Promethearchaeota archaeon]